MRRLIVPFLLLAALTLTLGIAGVTLFATARAAEPAEADEGLLVPASAPEGVQSAPIPVGPFTRLEVSGHAELVLMQGDREEVVVEGPTRGQARVLVRAADGRLTIAAPESRKWWSMFGTSGRRPTITVHFRQLETLGLSGSFTLHAPAIEGDTLKITASGASSIKVDQLRLRKLRFAGSGAVEAAFAGRVSEQEVSISGAGEYQARDLISESATVNVSGAGTAVVNVQKTLSATLSGVGEIAYYGNPEVKRRLTGMGKIERRSDVEPDVEPARLGPRATAAAPRPPGEWFRA